MSAKTSFKQAGTLVDADPATLINLRVVLANVTLIVADSASVTTAQTTNADDPSDSGALWSDFTFTNNGVSLPGPLTGIKLAATGADVDYSVMAMDLR